MSVNVRALSSTPLFDPVTDFLFQRDVANVQVRTA